MSENTTAQPQRTRATLVLDDGSAFPGFIFGATPAADTSDEIAGEVAFTTDMFGYERELCEAERQGQLLVFASPQVGNVGWTGEGASGSTEITAAAVIVRRDLAKAWPGTLGQEASVFCLDHHPAPVTLQAQQPHRRSAQALRLALKSLGKR